MPTDGCSSTRSSPAPTPRPPTTRLRGDPGRPAGAAPSAAPARPGAPGPGDGARPSPGRSGWPPGSTRTPSGIDALAALGFAFVEIGTVTGEPQPGNDRPRLFRLPARPRDRQPDGLQQRRRRGRRPAAGRARRTPRGRPSAATSCSGSTSARPRSSPRTRRSRDYEKSTRLLAPYADYLVVNVSSPNTPGLRDLQAVEKLRPLLQRRTRGAPTT